MDAAEKCVDLWHTLSFPVDVISEFERKFRVCFPLLAHAMNQVTTAIQVRKRLPFVAASNARIGLESALSAQWVLLTYEGEDQLVRAAEYQWQTRVKEFSAAVGHPEELAKIVATKPLPGELRSWSITKACARFSDTSLFYDVYRDLTQAVHPSFGLIEAHAHLGDDRNVLDRSGGLKLLQSTPQALGLAAVLALDAFERMRSGHPLLRRIEEVAANAGLPNDLALSDQEPHLQGPPA